MYRNGMQRKREAEQFAQIDGAEQLGAGFYCWNLNRDLRKLRPNGEFAAFFITQLPARKQQIAAACVKLLNAGCSQFEYFGAENERWLCGTESADRLLHRDAEEPVSVIGWEEPADFTDSLWIALSLRTETGCDVLLCYDDAVCFRQVLSALARHNGSAHSA